MRTKPLRDIIAGETFRPAGSPYWQRSTGDAQADTQRGICVVSCQPLGEMRGLGHLVCEVQHREQPATIPNEIQRRTPRWARI